MSKNDADFCCPITTELFTHPVIISKCGHTFNKSALRKLKNKKCPTCNAEFNQNNLPTNWIVASHLDLSIKSRKKKGKKDDYDADQAFEDYQNFIDDTSQHAVKMILKDIIPEIKKRARCGKKSYSFSVRKYLDDDSSCGSSDSSSYDSDDGNDGPMNEVCIRLQKILEAKKYQMSVITAYGKCTGNCTVSWAKN